MVCVPLRREYPLRSRLSHRRRLKTGFLQSRIDLVGDPFPDIRARRQQRGDLDGRELRSGVDEHPNRRARVVNKCLSKPFVCNQPPDEQLDAALCHVVSAFR